MARSFDKILVSDRGEIARRVFRTVRAMGIRSGAVYSDADADAPHVAEADEAVRLGPAPSRESYLAIPRILAAAGQVGADAIHPGYGFLSENAELAARCTERGMTFIGPTAEAIRRMGSKIEAKAIMAAAGVPVVPGTSGAGLDDAALLAAARTIGVPLLIKASAGGGGKGMRVVRDLKALPEALAAARREAASAFGDDTLLLERYFEAPRHVEIQIFGDTLGTVVHCFERECSIQRRYQKIIEEAPSPALDAHLRARMGAAAVTAGKAIGYVGAGTVEFILDAAGEPLPLAQDALTLDGHAIEARLYAEDPANDFLPATGRIAIWEPADLPGVRYDSGVAAGTTVGVHYDPLLAKIIAHGVTRAEATTRLVVALRRLGVAGVTTNRDLLLAVLTHPAFAAGALDTRFIDRHLPPTARVAPRDADADRVHAVVAALAAHERRRAGGPLPASIPSGWRNNRWRPQ